MKRLSGPTTTLLAVTSGLGALAALAGCAPATSTETTPESTSTETTTSPSTGEYADGTYTADGRYLTPGGESGIEVTLTVADGAVTDVQVVSDTDIPDSLQFQSQFISGIAAEVVGKNLDEISVSRIAGSSLTSQGFMAALAEIKADAAA